tara:strand:- start:226 stop:417 length:192 start_codon:yes stop_codon:yes gene_type:complete
LPYYFLLDFVFVALRYRIADSVLFTPSIVSLLAGLNGLLRGFAFFFIAVFLSFIIFSLCLIIG